LNRRDGCDVRIRGQRGVLDLRPTAIDTPFCVLEDVTFPYAPLLRWPTLVAVMTTFGLLAFARGKRYCLVRQCRFEGHPAVLGGPDACGVSVLIPDRRLLGPVLVPDRVSGLIR